MPPPALQNNLADRSVRHPTLHGTPGVRVSYRGNRHVNYGRV